MAGVAERLEKTVAALLVRPVVGVAVKTKIRETAREKMFRRKFRGVRVVFQDTGEFQLRPAKAEVHRRQLGGADEFREVVARAEPRKDAVAFPAPRDHFFAGVVSVNMPAMLDR